MSSEDPVSSATKGATEAFLEYGENKLKQWVEKFKNRKLAFIENPDTIKQVKDLRASPEWDVFTRFIDHQGLRMLFLMGLTLRHQEKEELDLDPLRRQIQKRYGTEGLHIAYFVQNGCFNKLLGNILERELTNNAMKKEIENLLFNLEKTVSFIDGRDDVDKKVKEIVIKITANSPKTFIISSACSEGGKTSSAIKKSRKIFNNVIKEIDGYTFELNKSDTREMYFLNKKMN